MPFIEDKFATVRSPEGRAVFGKSSGGFGALTLAMHHPEIFAHCVSHSGDMGFDACYGADLLKLCAAVEKCGRSLPRFVAEFRRSRDKAGIDFGAINALGMDACYSPNPQSPCGFDVPVDRARESSAVWKRWEALDPVHAGARRRDPRASRPCGSTRGRRTSSSCISARAANPTP